MHPVSIIVNINNAGLFLFLIYLTFCRRRDSKEESWTDGRADPPTENHSANRPSNRHCSAPSPSRVRRACENSAADRDSALVGRRRGPPRRSALRRRRSRRKEAAEDRIRKRREEEGRSRRWSLRGGRHGGRSSGSPPGSHRKGHTKHVKYQDQRLENRP